MCWSMPKIFTARKVSWIGIIFCCRSCGRWCTPSKVTWIGIIVLWNRNEDMPLYHIFKLIRPILFNTGMFFAEFWHRLHWLKTPGLMLSKQMLHTIATPYRRSSNTSRILKLVRYYAVIIARCGKLCMQTRWKSVLAAQTKTSKF